MSNKFRLGLDNVSGGVEVIAKLSEGLFNLTADIRRLKNHINELHSEEVDEKKRMEYAVLINKLEDKLFELEEVKSIRVSRLNHFISMEAKL